MGEEQDEKLIEALKYLEQDRKRLDDVMKKHRSSIRKIKKRLKDLGLDEDEDEELLLEKQKVNKTKGELVKIKRLQSEAQKRRDAHWAEKRKKKLPKKKLPKKKLPKKIKERVEDIKETEIEEEYEYIKRKPTGEPISELSVKLGLDKAKSKKLAAMKKHQSSIRKIKKRLLKDLGIDKDEDEELLLETQKQLDKEERELETIERLQSESQKRDDVSLEKERKKKLPKKIRRRVIKETEIEEGYKYIEKEKKAEEFTSALAIRLGLDKIKYRTLVPELYTTRVKIAEKRYYKPKETLSIEHLEFLIKKHEIGEISEYIDLLTMKYLPEDLTKQKFEKVLAKKYKTEEISKKRLEEVEKAIKKISPLERRKEFKPINLKIPDPPPIYRGNLKFGDKVEFVAKKIGRVEGIICSTKKYHIILVRLDGSSMKVPYDEMSDIKLTFIPEIYITGWPLTYIVNNRMVKCQEKLPPDMYQKRGFKSGRYISFRIPEPIIMRGIIVDFTESSFNISGLDNNTYMVLYNDYTIEKLSPEKEKIEPLKEPEVTIKKFYEEFISDHTRMRDIVKTRMFNVISKHIPGLKIIEEEDGGEKRIEWNLTNNPKKSWDKYYAEEFMTWFQIKKRPEMIARYPKDELWDMATIIYNEKGNILQEYRKFIDKHGIISDKDSVLDVIKKMEKSKNLDRMDVHVLSSLEAISEPEKIKGWFMNVIVVEIFTPYFIKNIPDSNIIFRGLVEKWIVNELNKLKPGTEDRMLFDNENKKRLEKLYNKYSNAYDKEIKERKIRKELTKRGRSNITDKGYNILLEIEKFERKVYAKAYTILVYLGEMLLPLVFLDGPISKYSRFFKEKLNAGLVKISSLNNATINHMFPEFSMNEKLSKSSYNIGVNSIIERLGMDTDLIVQRYKYMTTLAKIKYDIRPYFFPWKDYIVNINKTCLKDTKSGYYTEINTKTKKTTTKPIPLNDIVICYTPPFGFSCHSIKKILKGIEKGDVYNDVIDEDFPSKFITKIKKIYKLKPMDNSRIIAISNIIIDDIHKITKRTSKTVLKKQKKYWLTFNNPIDKNVHKEVKKYVMSKTGYEIRWIKPTLISINLQRVR